MKCFQLGDLALRDKLSYVQTYAAAHPEVGVTPEQSAAMLAAKTAYSTSLTTHQEVQTNAKAVTQRKNEDRKSVVELFEDICAPIYSDPTIPDSVKVDMGIKLPAVQPEPMPAPGEGIPELFIEPKIGQIVVHWGTNPQIESRNKKPSWVKGCLIFRKKGNETEFTLAFLSRKSPYIDNISGPADDYTYMARYVGKSDLEIGSQSASYTTAARGEVQKAA